jgi:hypothetical protein
VPALNTNATFIGDLADAVLQALPFAGSMAGSNPGDSLVPLGEVCRCCFAQAFGTTSCRWLSG